MNEYLKPDDVAEMFRVSKRTIHRWVAAGTFPKPVRVTHKTAIWQRATIDEWMNRPRDL